MKSIAHASTLALTAAALPSPSLAQTAPSSRYERTSSAPAAQPSPPAANACREVSEVSCLVNGYADRCCEIYKQAAADPAAPGGPALPEKLDRQAVAAGLAGIDTSECRGKSAAHGDVAVSVKVSPAGAVTAVTVKSSPDPALEACVVAAARQGTFARTQRGGAFSYAWRF